MLAGRRLLAGGLVGGVGLGGVGSGWEATFRKDETNRCTIGRSDHQRNFSKRGTSMPLTPPAATSPPSFSALAPTPRCRYVSCNPASFKSADVAYVLAYSVIMLNTDAHSPMVKTKMSLEEFVKNNRGIDDGADLPRAFLTDLYQRIVVNEIKMKDESLLDLTGEG